MLEIRHLPGFISYEDGLRLQEDTVAAVFAKESPDTLFLLEHQPVYTIGRLRDQSSLRDSSLLPYPVTKRTAADKRPTMAPGSCQGIRSSI